MAIFDYRFPVPDYLVPLVSAPTPASAPHFTAQVEAGSAIIAFSDSKARCQGKMSRCWLPVPGS
jgi:hypothetical protein